MSSGSDAVCSGINPCRVSRGCYLTAFGPNIASQVQMPELQMKDDSVCSFPSPKHLVLFTKEETDFNSYV